MVEPILLAAVGGCVWTPVLASWAGASFRRAAPHGFWEVRGGLSAAVAWGCFFYRIMGLMPLADQKLALDLLFSKERAFSGFFGWQLVCFFIVGRWRLRFLCSTKAHDELLLVFGGVRDGGCVHAAGFRLPDGGGLVGDARER